ncbi:hypothetical protein [uncultured Limimaricola sp.]|uniref:hypothetical protein n=1 Tax=uncultured Limimaricola sp. TaxID=2211667 RepID=UPI0030F7B512
MAKQSKKATESSVSEILKAKADERKSSGSASKPSRDAPDLQVITKEQWNSLLMNPGSTNEEIMAYSVPVIGRRGFEIILKPNPSLVTMTPIEEELESAIRIGNDIDRWRRYRRFLTALKEKPDRPLIVSEGDSWFQFPFFVKEVVDHLEKSYNVACAAAAGDTAQNMVEGEVRYRGREYLSQIWKYRDRTEAFLFSGAGNDIIGIDPSDGEQALKKILKKPRTRNPQPHEFVDQGELTKRLQALRRFYLDVIKSIRQYNELKTLPIIVHGYDYPFPFEGEGDPRTPLWARDGSRWITPAFDHHQIKQEHRRPVLMLLIDALYDMLNGLAGTSRQTHVWVVDCRKTLTKRSDWVDEIHATDRGFVKVARKFDETIKNAVDARRTVA